MAALYVDPNGPYPRMSGVEPWFRSDQLQMFGGHDALLYDGPHPVVAHPPCGPWGKLRHQYRGNEWGCGPRAVEQVRAFGGVLEHPAGSKLWAAMALPLPGAVADSFGGRTVEVCQVEWGHPARKRTWLYLVGASPSEPAPFPGREPTHWASGSRATPGRKRPPSARDVPPGIKVCSAQQRNRTPQLFAEYLVRLARSVKR